MGRGKKHQPEQVVNLLRQIEVDIANGKTTARASKELGPWAGRTSVGARSTEALQVDQATAEGVGAGELRVEPPGTEPEPG